MSKLDTSWIKWGNTDPTYSISHDINRLRQLINDALAEMSSNANSGFVQLYNTGKFNTIFSEDIVKQCTKELRGKRAFGLSLTMIYFLSIVVCV